MSPCRRPASSGHTGCTSRHRLRLWLCAARRLSKRPWRSPCIWTGRRCVPSVGRPILSGVPSVASGSCARVSSHGEEPLPTWPQRRAPHEIRTAGETCQGRGVPAGGQETGSTACGQGSGAADAPHTAIASSRVGPAEPVTGRTTEGSPKVNSIARGCQNLVKPHPYAVSPTKSYPKCSGPGGSPPRGSLP